MQRRTARPSFDLVQAMVSCALGMALGRVTSVQGGTLYVCILLLHQLTSTLRLVVRFEDHFQVLFSLAAAENHECELLFTFYERKFASPPFTLGLASQVRTSIHHS